MVVQLGTLLRRLLNAGEREFSRSPMKLQFVALYLELQSEALRRPALRSPRLPVTTFRAPGCRA